MKHPTTEDRSLVTTILPYQARDCLARQFETAWQLAAYHLNGLTTEECLWRPAEKGLHVHQQADGSWKADWPEHEGYDLGPSSIAWLTWHFGFWWSMALDHCFGPARLQREDVNWPGDAAGVLAWIEGLRVRWDGVLAQLAEDELAVTDKVRWPFTGRPLGDLIAWANVELTKSAAEIGYVRFLHAAASRR